MSRYRNSYTVEVIATQAFIVLSIKGRHDQRCVQVQHELSIRGGSVKLLRPINVNP